MFVVQLEIEVMPGFVKTDNEALVRGEERDRDALVNGRVQRVPANIATWTRSLK